MKKLSIIHIGVGNVGKALVSQIQQFGPKELVYCGIFTSREGVFRKNGLQADDFKKLAANVSVEDAIAQVAAPFILIDTTASDKTVPLMKLALKRGGFVVMSNKKPIASRQKDFDTLHKLGGGRLYYETTVGAGLPVINTIQTLLGTGDTILEIQGCFSGTLGFIFSELEKGKSFSGAVLKAKELGYTEPDPRDDLSGVDVARKAIILSRLIGNKLEMSEVMLESLYPSSMASLPVETFLTQIEKLDRTFTKTKIEAEKRGKVLRYVATISQKGCKVGLVSVARDSDIGNLHGPDNIVRIQTKRYKDNPIIIKGSGAGVEVTAAGVFGDVLAIARIFNFNE
jgi:homoserine dehydrogenase